MEKFRCMIFLSLLHGSLSIYLSTQKVYEHVKYEVRGLVFYIDILDPHHRARHTCKRPTSDTSMGKLEIGRPEV